MRFCSDCGASVSLRVPEGDDRARAVCTECGAIHYQNPRIIVGTLPYWQGQILLCKRAIEPRYGKWTLPAGFMENAETTAEAAARETVEEAGASVQVGALFSVVSVPHVNQVYMIYLAELMHCQFDPGHESLEVALFNAADIPWDELAFPTISFTLRRYFADKEAGEFSLHSRDIFFRPS